MKYLHLPLLFIIAIFTSSIYAQQPYKYITVDTENLYPEGITLDDKGNLYLSSFTQGKILKVNIDSQEKSDFTKAGQGDTMSTLGLFIDHDNRVLWACSSDLGVSDIKDKHAVALKQYGLETQKLLGSFDLPGGGFCNDITMDAAGNVYVTDSSNPRVLKLNKGEAKLSTWVEDDKFKGEGTNLNGIDFDGDKTIYVNKYNSGQLFKIDMDSQKVSEIKLPRALFAPDGLKVLDKNNLLTAEGGISETDPSLAKAGTGRITKIILGDPPNTGELEVIAEGLDLPTTFVLEQDKSSLWVIEAQYDHLFKYTQMPHYPFRVVQIPLAD